MTASSTPWMLRLARERWSLVNAVDVAAPAVSGAWTIAEASALAESIASFWAEQGLAPGTLLVSLDGSLCLSMNFSVASSRQLRKRDALLFQLEETLQVSAEEIVADFTIRQRAVFAVAAETALLEPLIVELAKAGIDVEAVAPEVVLAVEQHLQIKTWPARHRVLWVEREAWELVTIDSGRTASWQRLPPTVDSLDQTLRAAELVNSERLPIVAYGSNDQSAEVRTRMPVEWLSPDSDCNATTLLSQAANTTVKILAGQIDPPLQLLRGMLAASVKRRSPLAREWRLVQCAAALFLIMLAATQFSAWQTAKQKLAANTTAQADIYRELYPDKKVPLGIQTRLASDVRRLCGMRGSDAMELPAKRDALEMVQQVLVALPAELRFRMLELRVENGRLSLSGEVRSHGDADRIAAALRKQGLRVSPPSTQQLPNQGVDFRLTAEPAPPQEKSV